jgi:hypothetical protein
MVKNKICTDSELVALLEDDNGSYLLDYHLHTNFQNDQMFICFLLKLVESLYRYLI